MSSTGRNIILTVSVGNFDIYVADCDTSAVVVVNTGVKLRFRDAGSPSTSMTLFLSHKIATFK